MTKKNGIYSLNKNEIHKTIEKAWNIHLGVEDSGVKAEKLTGADIDILIDAIKEVTKYDTSKSAINTLISEGAGVKSTALYILCAYILKKEDIITEKDLEKALNARVFTRDKEKRPYVGAGPTRKNKCENFLNRYAVWMQTDVILNHDSRKNHLYKLVGWTENYQLVKKNSPEPSARNHTKSQFFSEEQQAFYEKKEAELTKTLDRNGELYYLGSYRDSWGEAKGEGSDVFHYERVKSMYSEKLAIEKTIKKYPEIRQKVEEFLDAKKAKAYLNIGLPTSLVLSITVLNEKGTQFLGVQRSDSTDVNKNEWTVGIYETMLRVFKSKKLDIPPLTGTLDNALYYGLLSELGLEKEDYSLPVYSFMGIVLKRMTVVVKAVIKLKITPHLLRQKWIKAIDRKEAHSITWFPFTQDSVYNIVSNPDDPSIELNQLVNEAGQQYNKVNNSWFFQAPTTLAQAWCMKDEIE